MKATYFFTVFICLTQTFFTVSYKRKRKKSYTAPVVKYLYVIPDTSIQLELLSLILSLRWDCLEPCLLHSFIWLCHLSITAAKIQMSLHMLLSQRHNELQNSV